MACLIEELRATSVAKWYSSASSLTRLKYYRAFLSLTESVEDPASLTGDYGHDLELRRMVTEAAGVRASSGLYALIGPNAASAMLVRADERLTTGVRVHRGAVARLAAEVKVWSHWPYRARWLAELCGADPHTNELATASLIRALATWAAENQKLAVTYGCDPPVSAVEDLLIISGRRDAADEARAMLTKAVSLAQGPHGSSPSEVLKALNGELTEMGLLGRPNTGRIKALVGELVQLYPRLPSTERGQLHEQFGSELADLAELMGGASLPASWLAESAAGDLAGHVRS